jgi:2,2-dialkylglycine decarboxylase (pyruvate)
LLGVELVTEDDDADAAAALGAAVTRRCLDLGLHVNVVQLDAMGGTLRIAPALTTSSEELARGVAILDEAVTQVTASPVGR